MLIVLGTMVVAVTACATLARLAATASMARRCALRLQQAGDLLRASDEPIVRWLNQESTRVVLPPEAEAPEVPVLADTWESGGEAVAIRITAYDQFGMLPAGLAGSTLRLAVPPAIADIAARVDSLGDKGQVLGLDSLADAAEQRGVALFPTPSGSERDSHASHPGTKQPAVGAWIGTHNTGRILNINTAPMPLVEAALRQSGRGGLEEVRKARTKGQQAAIPAPVRQRASEDIHAPVPSASSHVWAFRIDARVGPIGRSVWAVYSADSGEWRCVQRLVIDR